MKYESSDILRKVFLSLKASDDFTLRKWAELANLNSSTLNLIINSKRLLPKKHLKIMGQSLNLDHLTQDYLEKALDRDWLRKRGIKIESVSTVESDFSDIHEIEGDAVLLKSWLHLALLEFSTCKNFKEDLDFLSSQFQVSKTKVQDALNDLINENYLVRGKKGLEKKNKKMRIPTKRSRQIIRNFHIQMLDQARNHLQTHHDNASFQNRLITGYTVAVNPKNLPKAKLILENALIEASSRLVRGDCTEVYQLQLQLFPLKSL